jgi:hypothetical protein
MESRLISVIQELTPQVGISMLRKTVDFVPGAYNPSRRTIASMTMANASDLADWSNCSAAAIEGQNDLTVSPRSVSARARDHDRRQSVWSLIAKAAAAPALAESRTLQILSRSKAKPPSADREHRVPR